MDCEVILGILAVNFQNQADCKILVERNLSLPSRLLTEKSDSLTLSYEILKDITGLEPGTWLQLKQIKWEDGVERKVIEGQRRIALIYSVIIPEDIRILNENYKWMNISELCSKKMFMDHWNLVQEICIHV